MPIYNSTSQLYDCLETLFDRIFKRNEYDLSALERSGLVTRFVISEPAGELIIDCSQRPVATHFGPTDVKPNLTITLSADTLHGIMLGELGILKSLGARKLKAKGPIHKTKAFYGLFEQSQKVYPQILREKGVQ